MPDRTKPFNLKLDPTSRMMLDELARDNGIPRAQLVRELIVHRYKMIKNGLPTCANGDGCMMAGIWIQNQGATLQRKQSELPGTEAPPPIPHLFRDAG